MPDSDTKRRVTISCFIGVLALYAAFLWPGALYYAFGDDPSIYLVSAKSLATGHGYRLISDVAAPPATLYPIGYPAILAPLFLWNSSLPQVVYVARLLSLVFCVTHVLLGYALVKRYATRRSALLLSLLVGLTPQLFLFSSTISSEWPFATLSLCGLLLVCRGNESGVRENSRYYALGAGLSMGAGMLTRTVGVALVVGVAYCYLIGKRWIDLAAFAVGVAALYGVSILYWPSSGSNTFQAYLQWFADNYDLQTPLVNLGALVRGVLPAIFVPPMETILAHNLFGHAHAYVVALIGITIGTMLLLGLWSQLKRLDPPGVCLGCYLVTVMVWPWDPSRLVLPVLPLCVVTALAGSRVARRWLATRMWRAQMEGFGVWPYRIATGGLTVLCALALAIDGNWIRHLYVTGHHAGIVAAKDWEEIRRAFAWIKANTPTDAVLMSSYPEGTFLFTGRNTLRQPMEGELEPTIRRVNFVLATKRISSKRKDHEAEFGLQPVLAYAEAKPSQLVPRWRSAGGIIHIVEVAGRSGTP